VSYSWIASALWCVVALASYAQGNSGITVRLINISNGKPVTHREVFVYRIDPETHKPFVEKGFPLKGITDEEGKVSFSDLRLQQTSPEDGTDGGGKTTNSHGRRLSKRLDLQIIYAGGAGVQCSTGLFSLDEILMSGALGDNRCKEKLDLTRFKCSPGEVMMFVGKSHWWESGQT
jgi:hypothetical protein